MNVVWKGQGQDSMSERACCADRRPEPSQHAFAGMYLHPQCWKDRQDAGDLVGRKCSTR